MDILCCSQVGHLLEGVPHRGNNSKWCSFLQHQLDWNGESLASIFGQGNASPVFDARRGREASFWPGKVFHTLGNGHNSDPAWPGWELHQLDHCKIANSSSRGQQRHDCQPTDSPVFGSCLHVQGYCEGCLPGDDGPAGKKYILSFDMIR